MTDPAPPAWVTKRDGRLVPFEADRVSRGLFAAAETLGRADAFLCRELADAAVHFLARDCEGRIPTTRQVAAVVARVVSDLGQPALAAAFGAPRGDGRLARAHADARRGQTLSAVYTRDLTAAQQEGLLTLTDLDAPDALAARVMEWPADGAAPRGGSARLVALDGLDYFAALRGYSAGELARDLAGSPAVVNLNCAEAPSWADALAQGPLFLSQPRSVDRGELARLADELLEALAAAAVRVDWHLGESDFVPERAGRLTHAARLARRAPVCFVFDRPRRPVALAEGLDRSHPAALVRVELHLPALARQGGLLADADRFVARLGSLARLALSAAVQKRDHLRRRAPELTRGFTLDRARLVVTPVGLDEVVRLYTDWGLASGGASVELGRRIVARLRDVLRDDGRPAQLGACLDGPPCVDVAGRELVPGLTPWDGRASVAGQLRAAGALHALAEHGTLLLRPPADEPHDDAALAAALHQAWRQTEVVRLRLAG